MSEFKLPTFLDNKFVRFCFRAFQIASYALIAIYTWHIGPEIKGDTGTYFNVVPFRSFAYPLFLKLVTLFGRIHSLQPILVVQIILGGISVYIFTNYLRKQFSLKPFTVYAISIILLMPYFFGHQHIANVIQSEGIAYPMFLIVLMYLLKAVYKKDQRTAIIYFFCAAFLICMRTQFIIFHALSIILIIFLASYSHRKWRTGLKLGIYFILSLISISLSDKIYHKIAHNQFESTSYLGVQLLVPALYVSHESDKNLFANGPELEKGLFDTAIAIKNTEITPNLDPIELTDKGIQYEDLFTYEYESRYNALLWKGTRNYFSARTGYPQGKNSMDSAGYPLQMDYWKKLDALTLDMAIKLIKKRPQEFFMFYLYNAMSGFKDKPQMMFFFLLFGVGLIMMFRKPNELNILLVIACILMVLNIGLVAMVEPCLHRYMFYTWYLIYIIIIIYVSKSLDLWPSNEEKRVE